MRRRVSWPRSSRARIGAPVSSGRLRAFVCCHSERRAETGSRPGRPLLREPDLLADPVRAMLAEPGLVLIADSPPGPSSAVAAVSGLAELAILVMLADAGSASLLPQILTGKAYGRGTLGARMSERAGVVLNQVELDSRLSAAVLDSAAQLLGPRLFGAVCRDDALTEALADRRLLTKWPERRGGRPPTAHRRACHPPQAAATRGAPGPTIPRLPSGGCADAARHQPAASLARPPDPVGLHPVRCAALSLAYITVPMAAGQQAVLTLVGIVVFLVVNRSPSRKATLVLVFLSLVVTSRYLFWRATDTMAFESFLQGLLSVGPVRCGDLRRPSAGHGVPANHLSARPQARTAACRPGHLADDRHLRPEL